MSLSAESAPSSLEVRRLPLSRLGDSLGTGRSPLGALAYGSHGGPDWLTSVKGAILGDAQPAADVWSTGRSTHAGSHGAARWRTDGHWMLGVVEFDETSMPGGLEMLAREGYSQLFEAMRRAGCPHLQRIWNYLPRINEDGGGLERYRQFNVGRQQAFLETGLSVLEGAPAACALGVQRGGLAIHFLAGQRAPLAVENPRQVSAYRYPSDYGPRPPLFSRAALADIGNGALALFISGTASIVGHATVHPGNVAEQTRETLRNLAAVIDAARQRCSARFELDALDVVVYIRDAAHLDVVRQVLAHTLGPDSATLRRAVFLQADVCRADLLVEIEAHAVAPGALKA